VLSLELRDVDVYFVMNGLFFQGR